MEGHPEEDHHGEHQEQGHHTFLGLLRGEGIHHLGFAVFLMTAFHVLEPGTESIINGDGDNQGHAGHGEGEMIGRIAVEAQADGPFADSDGGGGGEEGADVDGHIEQGEAAVTLGCVLGFIVQVSHHYLEVALEQAGSEADEHQGRQHTYQRDAAAAQRNGQEQIAQEHNDDAGGDHLAEAEFIGQDTADEREEVHQHEERAVNGSGSTCREAEIGPEEERKDGDHGVIAEALTGVGQCQGE